MWEELSPKNQELIFIRHFPPLQIHSKEQTDVNTEMRDVMCLLEVLFSNVRILQLIFLQSSRFQNFDKAILETRLPE